MDDNEGALNTQKKQPFDSEGLLSVEKGIEEKSISPMNPKQLCCDFKTVRNIAIPFHFGCNLQLIAK